MRTVLFVCVHNAGRSQMAEALLSHAARSRGFYVRGASAGTEGGKSLNATAVQAMEEFDISMADQTPKLLTQEMLDGADRVISMGCGVNASSCPARFLVTEDWGLEDPAGKSIEKVREIRDDIARRVNALLDELSS